MQGFHLPCHMAEAVLSFIDAQHRHPLPDPKWYKPWDKRLGPGVVGLNLDLYAGSVLGLVGPNGAGKTTLLRMMAGILPLQKGEVKARFHSDTLAEVGDLRQWVGHMPEQVRWQGRMTVRDILIQLAEMRNVDQTRIDGLLGLVGLRGRQDEALNNLSQGMRQRLSIAAALLGSPKVLLLDEPFNGLDPVASQAFTDLVRRLASKGVSVVISSHMVAQLEGLVDRIALLHRGQLLDEGPMEDVERRLDLDGRYALSGTGEVDTEHLFHDVDVELLDLQQDDSHWSLTFRGSPLSVLQAAMANDVSITSWSPTRPNLVEWLCAATGMSVEDISLDVASSALLPMKTAEVGEDE